jgi:ABC-type phosphate transport system auxiliary subunit
MKNSMQNNRMILKNEEFLELVEIEVKKFLSTPNWHFLIERAKQENYFGSLHSKKDTAGLLGYLRMNFAMQIRILNNYNNHFEISSNHCKFLRSDWFKTQVLKNNRISYYLHFPEFKTYKFI